MEDQVAYISITKYTDGNLEIAEEIVAVEEPLNIKLSWSSATGQLSRDIAITMRTPGHDDELAAGYLFTEGILQSKNDISKIVHAKSDPNQIEVILTENKIPELKYSNRSGYVSSACGICGKTGMDDIIIESPFGKRKESITIEKNILFELHNTLRKQQSVFETTGGIHAAALFNSSGNLQLVREDIGRHNALDKIIGNSLMNEKLPLEQSILLLSGRASFELIQKAAMAGITIVASVGAPSSMAVSMARDSGITLIGFLRDNRFNIYTEFDKITINETSLKG